MTAAVYSILYGVYVVIVFRYGKYIDGHATRAYKVKQKRMRWLAVMLNWIGMKADILTFFRVLGAVVVIIMTCIFGHMKPSPMFWSGAGLAATDSLDGLMAIHYGESAFGTLVDPIADKLLFVAFSLRFVGGNWWIGFALCVTYVLFATTLTGFVYCKMWLRMSVEKLKATFRSTIDGKLKNVFQLIALANLYLSEIFAGQWFAHSEISVALLLMAVPLEIRSQYSKFEKIRQFPKLRIVKAAA